MKKAVKFILLGLVIIAAVAGYIYSVNAPVAVPLTQVTAKTAELSFSEQGLVVAENVVQVYPTAQGRIIEVPVTENQNVNPGDVICVIDSESFKFQISQAESAIKGYEAQIANLDSEQTRLRNDLLASRNSLMGELAALEAQERSSNLSLEAQNVSVEEQLRLQHILIEQAQKDVDRAREELARAEILYEAGSISKAAYEEALNAVEKYEDAVEAAEQQLVVISGNRPVSSEEYYSGAKASINAQIQGIDNALANNYTEAMKSYYSALAQGSNATIAQLRNEIANCTVTAPVAGVITQLYAKNTNYVTIAAPVAEVTEFGDNNIEVYVSTNDVSSLEVGDTVGLTLKRRESDAVFGGKIIHIDDTAEIRLTAMGAEERKVKVTVEPNAAEVETADAEFGIGFSIDVKFILYSKDNKLTVPKTALFKDNDRDMLWIVREGIAETIEVEKGMELRTETVIESGLTAGDYIVTDANNATLKPGVRIENEQ